MKTKMLLKSLYKDESGQDLIEYALVAAVIGLGAVATLKSVATSVQSIFTSINAALTAATS